MTRPYYEGGGVTLYHGDCREVLPTLARDSVDLLLTDPPYGVGLDTSRRTSRAPSPLGHGGYRRPSAWATVIGDDHAFDPVPWLAFPRVILWGANHYADRLPASAAWLVWDKREGTTSDTCADCELAWTSLGGPARLYRQLWRGMIRRGEENGTVRLHPTQKPVALMQWCLEQARLAPGSLVLDPYMGSGPIAIACQRSGYQYIGIEIEERYCETAAKRLEQAAQYQAALPLEVGA